MKVEFPGSPPGGGDGTPGGSSGQIQYNNAGNFGGVASTGTGDVVRASGATLTNPIVGTQSPADNSTKAASTAYVDTALAGVVQVLAGEVATFADLPAAASHTSENYLVRTSTGVYFVNRKVAGIYTSNGSAWIFDGDSTEAYFQDTLAWTNITSKPATFPPVIGSGAGDAVAGNDSRLTNERVPTAAGLTTKFGTNKATVVDGDKITMLDSAASDAPVHILWSLVKSTLKTYFDSIYQAAGSYLTSGGALGTPSSGNLANCTFPTLNQNTTGTAGGLSALTGVKKVIGITIDGAGTAITTGVKGYLRCPWACTITKATLLADQTGSIVIDVWNDTYANFPPTDADTITASAPPTITTATKSEDSTLTGWDTSTAAGSVFGFNVDSCTSITRVTLEIEVTLT